MANRLIGSWNRLAVAVSMLVVLLAGGHVWSGDGRVAGTGRSERASAAPRYLLTIVNLNYFPPPADQRLAAQALQEFIAIAREHGVEPELFFTGLAFDMYREQLPELLEELKRSGRDWHHHGSNRPPSPTPIDRVRGLPWHEAVKAVQEYERYAISLPKPRRDRPPMPERSKPPLGRLDHSRIGGLKKMCAYFGRPPFATGRWMRAPILAVCRQYGARMGVGLQDTFQLESAWCWYMGVLNRPDDVFVHPTWDFNPWVRHCWAVRQGLPGQGNAPAGPPDEPLDLKQKLQRRLAKLDPQLPAFVTFCFHDNDFFGYRWRSRERYSDQYRRFYMAKCDEFLSWLIDEQGLRPIPLREAYQMAAARNLKPTEAEAPTLARRVAEAVAKEGGLPLYVADDRSAYSLAECWQLFAAVLSGRRPSLHLLLGPIEPGGPSERLGSFTGPAIRQAASSVTAEDSVPPTVHVGGTEVNAAEFLYLMAKTLLGDDPVHGIPLSMLPVRVAKLPRAGDLEKLQFWSYKPAFYADTGGRVQPATSVAVNVFGQRQRRSGRMRRVPPSRRPPW